MNPIRKAVLDFYTELPFNYKSDASQDCETIRSLNQVKEYVPLANALAANPKATVLDAGCGGGWFTNTVAHYYPNKVLGLDMTEKAISRAREISFRLGTAKRAQFVLADLLNLPAEIQGKKFDIVSSLGVLHHTSDCRQAFRNIAELVAPGGFIHVGLYHRYGRQALLERFEPLRSELAKEVDPQKRAALEARGFEEWKALYGQPRDEVFARSWFRDQCLHPHETQWTLQETVEWAKTCGFEALANSIDGFAAQPNWAEVFAKESELTERGRQRMKAGVYYPGFFVLWAKKK